MTRQGWVPGARALKWSDLDLVVTVSPDQIITTPTNRYLMQLSLPYRTGQHILYSVWQRSDSQEACFNCSDVSFDGNVVPPSTAMQQLGQISAAQDLAAGNTVKLRVFGPGGTDLESQSLAITASNGAKATWLAQLADLTNTRSAFVRIGALQNGTVSVPAGATVLQVYALAGQEGIGYAVDITTQQPQQPGSNGDTLGRGRQLQGRPDGGLQGRGLRLPAGPHRLGRRRLVPGRGGRDQRAVAQAVSLLLRRGPAPAAACRPASCP
jgi:chitin-binding protein